MMASNRRQFYFIVADEDNGVFNLLGPMTDDLAETEAVVNLMNSGRNVRCSTFDYDDRKTKREHAGDIVRQLDLRYTDESILSLPDTSISGIPYRDSLPQYASRADRGRLVKMLCKGKCGCTRWAEMNRPYLGQEQLKEYEMFEVEARCLMCGYRQNDNYNWYR